MYRKKAEMSIFGALIAFAIIVLICPVFEFYQVSRKTEIAEQNIKSALMDTCVSDAIIRYDDIKYLNTETYVLDANNYEQAIFNSLGYTESGSHSWKKGEISVSGASLNYNEGSRSLISIPFKILNKTVKISTVEKKDIIAFDSIVKKPA